MFAGSAIEIADSVRLAEAYRIDAPR